MPKKLFEKSTPKQHYYKNNRFQQLKGFCYTVQTGSMSNAAKKMRLTQGAVSLQIKSLERDLGVQLFERGKNNIELTTEGKKFYTHVAPHIYGADEMFEDFIKYLKQEKSNIINIAANNVSICYILPKYLQKFEVAHPEVKFEIRNLVREEAIKRLMNNEVDMLIYSMKIDEVPKELDFIPIVEYKPILLTRKNHPLAIKKNLKLSDVKSYSLLRLDQKFVTVPNFDEIAKHYGLKTKIEFEMGNYEILKKFVTAGIGISIVSSICLEGEKGRDLVGNNLTEYFPGIIYGILVKKGKKHYGLTQDFIKILTTEKLLQAQIE